MLLQQLYYLILTQRFWFSGFFPIFVNFFPATILVASNVSKVRTVKSSSSIIRKNVWASVLCAHCTVIHFLSFLSNTNTRAPYTLFFSFYNRNGKESRQKSGNNPTTATLSKKKTIEKARLPPFLHLLHFEIVFSVSVCINVLVAKNHGAAVVWSEKVEVFYIKIKNMVFCIFAMDTVWWVFIWISSILPLFCCVR